MAQANIGRALSESTGTAEHSWNYVVGLSELSRGECG